MQAKMLKMRAKLLRDRLGFDANVVQQVEDVLRAFDPQRHELHKKKHQGHRQIKELLEADSNDQSAYQIALTNMRAAHVGLNNLRTEEMDKLGEILTPKQQARLARVFKRMKHKMQKFRKRMRPDKKRRGDGPRGCDCAGECSERRGE